MKEMRGNKQKSWTDLYRRDAGRWSRSPEGGRRTPVSSRPSYELAQLRR